VFASENLQLNKEFDVGVETRKPLGEHGLLERELLLPIQKFLKIFSSKSSVVISPVISPSKCRERSMSMATKSFVTSLSKPERISSKDPRCSGP